MKLEHEIDFRWLILFALPTIFSSIFANLYTTVDGIFVAQWVNTDALSAILSFCRTMVFMVIPVLVWCCRGFSRWTAYGWLSLPGKY